MIKSCLMRGVERRRIPLKNSYTLGEDFSAIHYLIKDLQIYKEPSIHKELLEINQKKGIQHNL